MGSVMKDIPNRPPPQLAFAGAIVSLIAGLLIGFVTGIVVTMMALWLF